VHIYGKFDVENGATCFAFTLCGGDKNIIFLSDFFSVLWSQVLSQCIYMGKLDFLNFLCDYDTYIRTTCLLAFWACSNITGNCFSNSTKESDFCKRDIKCDMMVRNYDIYGKNVYLCQSMSLYLHYSERQINVIQEEKAQNTRT